ncbi:MAG: ATP-binding protein [Syntrophobacteraceae bacterium]
MEHGSIKVLLIEDNPADARFIAEIIRTGRHASRFDLIHKSRLRDGLQYLKESERPVDAILLDLSLPDSQGFDTFLGLLTEASDLPIIVLTGIDDETVATRAVQEGAQDYLAKGQVDGALLSRSILYAIERKRTEKALKDFAAELVSANEDLRKQAALLDLSHDAIFVVDSAGVVNFWNRGAEDLYGFTREQAIGNVAYEFLQTRFPESLERVVNQVIDKGQWAGELRHTTSRGKELVVESRWALQPGRDGEPAGFLEVNRDITSRKIVEERLWKADRALRTLSECNQAVIRQAEESELLHHICRIVVEVGGYRMAWVGFAEHDEKKTVRPVAHAGYDDGYLDKAGITWADEERGMGPTGTAIRTGETCVSKNAFQNPFFEPWRLDAYQRGFASSIALPLAVEGKTAGALTIYAPEPDAFDEREVLFLKNLSENLAYRITSLRSTIERRRSEEALKVYTARLELVNAELQDFAFVAAHDLQEPLRKIHTFCDMTVKRCAPVLDSTSKDYLDRVIKSASRMRQLLSDLLQFSQVATKPEPLEKIDLVKIVREAVDVFEETVKNTGALVDIGNMPSIEADESQMLRLFQNLIGNALKFHSGETPHIKVYGKLDRKGICEILVKDNGIGFAPKFAERIFKPFQRLHGRGEYDGTGMGLSICRKIVERHGGTIWAESEPGKGSTFIIRLPVKQGRWEGM